MRAKTLTRNPMLLMMMMPHLCVCHQQVHKLLTKSHAVPEWCNCSCCRAMPQDMENKCCGRRNCVSQTRRFRKLCLDAEYLLLCVKNTADIRNDRQDSSSRTFRKAAYRNYFRHPWLPWKKEEESCSLLLCTLHSPTLPFCDGYIYGVPTAMKCPRRKNYSNSL